MAQIVINEISDNYSYSVGNSSFATIAMPITSSWGPGYFDPESYYAGELGCKGTKLETMLDNTVWQRFPATQSGLEAFVSTYRGPITNYRLAKDYSYQMAMTYLTAGYDVLVCRMCPGTQSSVTFHQLVKNTAKSFKVGELPEGAEDDRNAIVFTAKYPGSFGDNIRISISLKTYWNKEEKKNKYYWNVVTYVVDSSGVQTSVENKSFVFGVHNSTETILHYQEIESNFWVISAVGDLVDDNDENTDKAELKVFYNYDTHITTYEKDPADDKKKIAVEHQVQSISQLMAGGRDYVDFKDIDAENPLNAIIEGVRDTGDYNTEIGEDNGEGYHYPSIKQLANRRYNWRDWYLEDSTERHSTIADYPTMIDQQIRKDYDTNKKLNGYKDIHSILYMKEWIYSSLVGLYASATDEHTEKLYEGVFDLLKDKLSYNPNRIMTSGWDDQNYFDYGYDESSMYAILDEITEAGYDCETCPIFVSPFHVKLMDVSYHSRCATGMLDIPKVLDRRFVSIEDEYNMNNLGYAQMLARLVPVNEANDTDGSLFHTHSALYVPWAQYTYVGTSKMNTCPPSFLANLIHRAQILNQAAQYEWILPTNKKHDLRIGKLDYTVTKKVLDQWQKLDGVGVNVITNIPDLGINVWGNSTLYEVPPATYQALANLSTRWLVNAIEDVVYRVGTSITFTYNNNEAYASFYAGCVPILDLMKNQGAIEDYRIKVSNDLNGLDKVNYNTVLGKIWITPYGVVNDIIVDLIAMPPGTNLDLYI